MEEGTDRGGGKKEEMCIRVPDHHLPKFSSFSGHLKFSPSKQVSSMWTFMKFVGIHLSKYYIALSDVTEIDWRLQIIKHGQDTCAYEQLQHKPFPSGNQAKTKSLDMYFLWHTVSHEEAMQDKKSSVEATKNQSFLGNFIAHSTTVHFPKKFWVL